MAFLWFILLATLVFSIGFWLTKRLQSSQSQARQTGPSQVGSMHSSALPEVPIEVQCQVDRLMEIGHKGAAIKLLRESMGWSAQQAREYIEGE
jgi:hypothetical protein